MDFSYSITGFIVGVIIGLTGVGGGSLMTPALVIFFGIKPVVAVGTDLLYAAITKSGGIVAHHYKATIKWRIVGYLSLGSIPACMLSLLILKHLDTSGKNYEQLIVYVLSSALLLTSLTLLVKDRLRDVAIQEKFTLLKLLHTKYAPLITVLSGVVIGTLVTLSSVGAGVIGATFLFLLYPHLRTVNIVATDLAHAVPITAIAGLGHANFGTVDFELLGYLIIGSLPGIFLGSQLSSMLSEKVMRFTLSGLLLAIGIWLAFS